MFLKNKYTKWYYSIIENATSQNRPFSHIRFKMNANGNTVKEYYEDHHIIPKCMGGNNTVKNKVVLTSREHFICHLLLTKMVSEPDHKRKMAYALWNLSTVNGNRHNNQNRDIRVSSRIFQYIREQYNGNVNGYKHSEETKQKMRESAKKVKHLTVHYGEDNPEFKGYYHTPWGKFVTSYEAQKQSPYKMDRKRITKICKNNEQLFTINFGPRTYTPKEWGGLTAKEVGFWFEPIK